MVWDMFPNCCNLMRIGTLLKTVSPEILAVPQIKVEITRKYLSIKRAFTSVVGGGGVGYPPNQPFPKSTN